MSQMEINQVLAQIRALSARAARPQAPAAIAANGVAAAGGAPATEANSFAAMMKRGIGEVNATQQSAAQLATAFQQGVPGVELPQVMLEMQKASVSFRAATEVRNRLVSVYQEIMNMPI